MREEEFVLVMFSLVAVVGLLLAVIVGPIGRAFSRRIEGRRVDDETIRGLREDAESHAAEVADLRRDVLELQERVDFAERLLAHPGEPAMGAGPPTRDRSRGP